ncbi:helix-turn-helix transcriptional regulator [Protaetiibacter mangrovi]|uniref:helix-turn-helix transcriptional regulator n=1 Tax=Protaetiibacter mangrovi TaxID=2970926 RepID=UPI0027E413F6|nr:WYL domain-containing protein [Protaetiibacter mangrovi]
MPLETIEPLGEPGDNHNLRYRIPKGAYDLPEDVRFSSEEVALLGLAAMAWREGSLSAESRRALVKLRALGISADEPVLGYAPRLRLRDSAFEPLTQAIDRRQLVRFDYLKPGEARARERQVIPLALVQYDGRWHLSAEEVATGEIKTFLLRRIVGKVTSGRPAPDRAGDHTARALAGLEAVWERGVAELEVRAGSDAALRLAHRRGTEEVAPGILRVHHVDLAILADELAGFGPEVLVVSPPELRDAVRERLERTVADHA